MYIKTIAVDNKAFTSLNPRYMSPHYPATLLALTLSIPCATALAQQDAPKAIVAVVGDVDRFLIGQDGYCGNRNDVDSPSGKQFRIPADKPTFFNIQSKVHAGSFSARCEGEYSFTPIPAMLHIVRYTMAGNQCKLEMFISNPGGSPVPAEFQREERRSCLFEKK